MAVNKIVNKIMNIVVLLYLISVFVLSSQPKYSISSFILTILLLILLFIRYMLCKKLYLPKLSVFLIIFPLYGLITVIWVKDYDIAIRNVFMLSSAVVGAIAFWISLYNGVKARTIHIAALISAIIIIISVLIEVQTNPYSMRYSGILLNPNIFALNISIIAIMLFSSRKKTLLFHVIGIVFVIFATIFSGSRKIAFFWLLFIIYIYKYTKKFMSNNFFNRFIFYIIIGGLITVIFFYSNTLLDIINTLEFVNRFQQFFAGNDDTSGNVRIAMIKEGIYLWAQAPFFGNGIGQFSALSSFGTYSHNNYIEVLCNFGIIGFCLYYGIYILIINQLIRRRKLGLCLDRNLVWFVIILFLLWDTAMVSVIEKKTWILFIYALYICSDQKQDTLALSK